MKKCTEGLTGTGSRVMSIPLYFMHSSCTSLIGQGISYVHKRRKLFYCGTFSLLISAAIAHGLFNTLIQSQYKLAAYGVIVAMYIPQIVKLVKKLLSRREAKQA